MLLRKLWHSIPLWLLLLALPVTVSAQRAGQPAAASAQLENRVSYLFVSPNTREGLSADDALRRLDSGEEAELIAEARGLTRCLGMKAEIAKALGSWTDGAEHMALIKTAADEATARYVNARLGMAARQKSVLYFRVHSGGGSKMYVLKVKPGRDLTEVIELLDGSGIRYRTIIPGPRRVLVYVVDLDGELGESVYAAARRLGGRYGVLIGTGAFIGDGEDRESAREVYRDVVSRYEASRPRAEGVCGAHGRAPGSTLGVSSRPAARR